jgi:ribonuclease Z
VPVTAFAVDHSPVAPALGYRSGRAVVLSGDTRASDNLVRFAEGADVVVHEVLDATTVREWFPDNPTLAASILAKHTTPAQAGELYTRIKPRLAVYSHAPRHARILAETRQLYTGPLEGAEDLLVIEVGDSVRVIRPAQ